MPPRKESTAPRKRRQKRKPMVKLTKDELASVLSSAVNSVTALHSFAAENDVHLLPSQSSSLHSSLRDCVRIIARLHSRLSLSDCLSVVRLPPTEHKHTSCWFERFSYVYTHSHSDAIWPDFFRISKPSFDRLLATVSPTLGSDNADSKLAAALFRFAHGVSFPAVGKLFGFDDDTACASFYQVCKALQDRLGFEYSPASLSDVIRGFFAIGIPNCCGILGFRKFSVEEGSENGVNMMGLFDSDGRFMDVSVGWPISMPPAKILPKTHLFSEGKETIRGSAFELGNGYAMPVYVLGDTCCPNLPWLMTPFSESGSEDDEKRMVYNSVHQRGMKVAETAFGRLQSVWQLLKVRPKAAVLKTWPVVVSTACILHNFMLRSGESMPKEVEDQLDRKFPNSDGGDENGQRARDALASHIMASQKVTY